MTTAKTYNAMMAGSRFEFNNGKTVFFVGDKASTGAYTTDDADEIAELDKVTKTIGSGISEKEVPTMKAAALVAGAGATANTAAAIKAHAEAAAKQ